MDREKISAGILAGGKSSRMGRNKAFLPWKNSTMIGNLTRLFEDFFEIMISVGDLSKLTQEQYQLLCMDDETGEFRNFELIEDERHDYGPMEGVYQLLKNSSSEWVFVVATDMPFMDEQFIELMCGEIPEKAAEGESYPVAIIPRDDEDKIHPLCGLYHRSILPDIEEIIQEDKHKMTDLLDIIPVKYIDIRQLDLDIEILENVNTPEEYKNLVEE